MRIGVPQETLAGERRVALTPDGVARLTKGGLPVVVQRGAGSAAGFPDDTYAAAGATLADGAAEALGAEVVLKVRRPNLAEVKQLAPGALVVALMQPSASADVIAALRERGVTALALEQVPRITRAQSMDVLSSQATVAGYKAVLIGAAELGKFLPMLTTAAGNIPPAKVFVIGAGVAGLQAIATARRLGGMVSAFDVRAAAREHVQSLGATFVAAELASEAAQDAGGYAKAQSAGEQERTAAAIGAHIASQDLVVTTAQLPGRPAPVLITEAMVHSMRPGSVIVDLAAESGGNCALTKPNETVRANGVTILGPTNLAATLPTHASQMLSKNIVTLLQHMTKEGKVVADRGDEIVKAMVVT